MNRKRPGPREDPKQLRLDWTARLSDELATPPSSVSSGQEAIADRPSAASPVTAKRRNAAWVTQAKPSPRADAVRRREGKRAIARLPVPRPLPGSVAAGHFGHDEDGKAIRPQADEIRAITENLAERLIEMLDAMSQLKQDGARQGMQEQFTQAIQMYALEFGEAPARQLEAYVRRQASLEDDDRAEHGHHR